MAFWLLFSKSETATQPFLPLIVNQKVISLLSKINVFVSYSHFTLKYQLLTDPVFVFNVAF